ncbi:lipase [Streptococcus sp. H49]|uniref:YqiA/YcfP family alpha/beta fold hydrolase n=1 Tax=Streptococcus huangxiaojuni TaxID=3237239 RepID=UPI0034A368E6
MKSYCKQGKMQKFFWEISMTAAAVCTLSTLGLTTVNADDNLFSADTQTVDYDRAAVVEMPIIQDNTEEGLPDSNADENSESISPAHSVLSTSNPEEASERNERTEEFASSNTVLDTSEAGADPVNEEIELKGDSSQEELPDEAAVFNEKDSDLEEKRTDIKEVLAEQPSSISTLDAAALTYAFEKARLKGATDDTILEEIQKNGQVIPPHLIYLSDFYDEKTGTSGTAFKDVFTDKVLIAYTGTNIDGNNLQDALGADLMGIGLARGQHYQPAYDFYDKIANQYGAEIIVITGHSLGGNIAQRVALKKNASETVVYNAAPLYIPAIAYLGNKIYDSLQKRFDLPSNKAEAKQTISDIKNELKTFTGKVIRITTQKDWLNNAMRPLGAVYLGKEYIIPNSGKHDLKSIANDAKQIASIKTWVSV